MSIPKVSDTSYTSDASFADSNKLHGKNKPKSKYLVNERRKNVHLMLSQGMSESEIASKLHVNQSTISRDVTYIDKERQRGIQDIAKKVFPFEFSKSILCLDQITKACWTIYNDTTSRWLVKIS